MILWKVVNISNMKRRLDRVQKILQGTPGHMRMEETVLDSYLFVIKRAKGIVSEATIFSAYRETGDVNKTDVKNYLSQHYALPLSKIFILGVDITDEEWNQRYLVYEPGLYTRDGLDAGSFRYTGQPRGGKI